MKAIILGNGPSLIDTWPADLHSKNVVSFAVNRIFKMKGNLPAGRFRLDYYVALDMACWLEEPEFIKLLGCKGYFTWEHYLKEEKPAAKLKATGIYPMYPLKLLGPRGFSESPFLNGVYHCGTSVAAAVQIAAYMSKISEIHIFGMDLDKDGEKTHFWGTHAHRPTSWEATAARMDHMAGLCKKKIVVHSKIFYNKYKLSIKNLEIKA